ncbi:MAG TPA: hypothetical protein VMR25_17365 [Planctomycetaceae bacterium]|jgi:hypothetical protein|nr:hypothetical protein [Planctomycetaceae bacterium]
MKPLRLLLAIVALAFCGDLIAKTPTPKDKKDKAANGKFPTFETVTRTVEKQLAARDSYRSGDLLTVTMVELLFRKLEKINWKVADRRDILKSVLPDSDWMARQFSWQNGRDFMRQVADLPGGYDRVDRLRRMPYGQQQMADLMRGPDGYKLFEYMTTTQGGKNLGNMLSHGVNGEDFNRPTGRIYTEIDLIKRLKKSYDAETVRRLSLETPAQAEERKSPPKQEPPAPAASSGANTAKPPQAPVSDDPFENLPRSR